MFAGQPAPFVIGQPDHTLDEGNAEVMGVFELRTGERRMPEIGTSLEAWLARRHGAEVCIVQIAVRPVSAAQVRVFEADAQRFASRRSAVFKLARRRSVRDRLRPQHRHLLA